MKRVITSHLILLRIDSLMTPITVNSLWENCKLVDGYAPFCKHIIVDNFTDATPGVVAITDDNLKYIQCGYTSRREEELAVLSRWLPRDTITNACAAKYLDLILYSREQCRKERQAMGQGGHAIPTDLHNKR
eukprot:GHVR01180753.1.p1 GENE.GHVR01180753.1~~GHVR01180753.1.p1  ORF type:complete len:132 (-),score=10.98 GHVR01180753.1:257-652(-)